MEDVRKQDPCFTNFVPRTAAEAVDRYVRCRKNGLKPMLVPECLIACAKGLTGVELDHFEAWIINPNDDLSKVELVPENTGELPAQEHRPHGHAARAGGRREGRRGYEGTAGLDFILRPLQHAFHMSRMSGPTRLNILLMFSRLSFGSQQSPVYTSCPP